LPPGSEQSVQGRLGAGPAEPIEASHIEILDAAPPAAPKALMAAAQKGGWAEILADLTGNPSLEGTRVLGVCALKARTPENGAAVALAQWVAQYVDRPALLVEAHFGAPRLARAFGARNVGVADVIVRGEDVAELIQDTASPNLKLLSSGDWAGGRERRRAWREFPTLLRSLRESFSTVVVELPAVDDPAFLKIPAATLTDAVILVANSKTAPAHALQGAAEALRRQGVNLAATMLDATSTPGAELRRGRPAEQLRSSETRRYGSQLGI
jgi:Mrp family chromosome partitioning ATPase